MGEISRFEARLVGVTPKERKGASLELRFDAPLNAEVVRQLVPHFLSRVRLSIESMQMDLPLDEEEDEPVQQELFADSFIVGPAVVEGSIHADADEQEDEEMYDEAEEEFVEEQV